jgi:hypothetical protein
VVVGTIAKIPGRSSWTSLSAIAGLWMETATRSRSFAQMDSSACTAEAGRWTIAGRLRLSPYLVCGRCSNGNQNNEYRASSSPPDSGTSALDYLLQIVRVRSLGRVARSGCSDVSLV